MKIEELRFNFPIPLGKIAGKYWIFQEEWEMSAKVDGLWHNFHFKKGTVTDLGSVPARVQGIVNNGSGDGLALAIFLGHDDGYECHVLERSWYDAFLLEGLAAVADPNVFDAWDATLAYGAVRFFGGTPWKKASKSKGMYKHVPFEPKPIYGLPVQWKARK